MSAKIEMYVTYFKVANKHRLTGYIKFRYVLFMSILYPVTVNELVDSGFADIMADNFKKGEEYKTTDIESKKILQLIDFE